MKSYLQLVVLLSIYSSSFAQKLKIAEVPEVVQQAFARNFPGVDKLKWEREEAGYEASFKQNKLAMSVVLDAQGGLLETEKEINVDALPAAVLAYVKEHYGGASIKEAASITGAQGNTSFEVGIKGKELLFDAQGKFLKEEKD